AGEIVAGITQSRIGGVLADMARRIDDQIPAITDEIVVSSRAERVDLGGVPVDGRLPQEVGRIVAYGPSGRGAKQKSEDQSQACPPLSHHHPPNTTLIVQHDKLAMIVISPRNSASMFGNRSQA